MGRAGSGETPQNLSGMIYPKGVNVTVLDVLRGHNISTRHLLHVTPTSCKLSLERKVVFTKKWDRDRRIVKNDHQYLKYNETAKGSSFHSFSPDCLRKFLYMAPKFLMVLENKLSDYEVG